MYKTSDGIEYDISELSEEERILFNLMENEYESARSWIEFQQRTAHRIIEVAKKSRKDWQNHPLYNIQLDMVGKKGVETGELRRELTDKLTKSLNK